MNRKMWEPEWIADWPDWPCPTCRTGTLKPVKDLHRYEDTAEWKRTQYNSNPYDISQRFSSWLRCNRTDCREPAVVIGEEGAGPEFDDEGNDYPVRYYRPVAIEPSPHLFNPPKRCPEDVQVELVRAFALFLRDPTAAGNALRGAVERILDHKQVPRTLISKNHKRVRINLHLRIERFKAANLEAAAALMAVKWIGNEGSHAGSLSRSDVLDAMEMVENVVDQFWGEKDQTLKRRIAGINKSKKPRSKQRKPKKKASP
jgi:hypothetical protein